MVAYSPGWLLTYQDDYLLMRMAAYSRGWLPTHEDDR